MSHAFDMINRLKMNKEIKGKKKSFPTSNSISKSKGEFKFPEPTEEDLKRLELSNKNFLKKRRRINIIAAIVSFTIAFIVLNWVYMDWPWKHMVTGFMKGYGR